MSIVGISLASQLVSAESHIPIGLQKIIDYNNSSTAEFAVKISFFIAFVAGILGILSPCILPLLPAYFSYTFKEKKNITLMTLVFFSGFTLAFVSMGVVAGFIGEQVISIIQTGWLVTVAGIGIIIFGIMSLLGNGFSSFIRTRHKFKNDILGTFLFGLFFAVGWTACLGPILAGILGIGAILHNPITSGTLLFFYSLGNLVPLFILSIFYDNLNLSESKLLAGKQMEFSIGNKKYHIHSINLISGILFLLIGATIIIFQGTGIVNTFDIFGTRQYFYSIQDALIQWEYAKPFSLALFIVFLAGIGTLIWKIILKRKGNK